MEKYTINTAIKGFTAGQQVTRDELVLALKIPIGISDNDMLFSLAMADVISFIMPKKFSKDIFLPGSKNCTSCNESFKASYSLIDEESMMYSSDIDGLPDAMIEELTELGYMPMYSEKKEGRPYLELNGVRYFSGDNVYRLTITGEIGLFDVIKISDEFFSEKSKEGEFFFADMVSMNDFITKRYALVNDPINDLTLPVEEKRFSVVDIQRICNDSEANNGSLFYNSIIASIIESALVEVA